MAVPVNIRYLKIADSTGSAHVLRQRKQESIEGKAKNLYKKDAVIQNSKNTFNWPIASAVIVLRVYP